jgi:hypothetical protein
MRTFVNCLLVFFAATTLLAAVGGTAHAEGGYVAMRADGGGEASPHAASGYAVQEPLTIAPDGSWHSPTMDRLTAELDQITEQPTNPYNVMVRCMDCGIALGQSLQDNIGDGSEIEQCYTCFRYAASPPSQWFPPPRPFIPPPAPYGPPQPFVPAYMPFPNTQIVAPYPYPIFVR